MLFIIEIVQPVHVKIMGHVSLEIATALKNGLDPDVVNVSED